MRTRAMAVRATSMLLQPLAISMQILPGTFQRPKVALDPWKGSKKIEKIQDQNLPSQPLNLCLQKAPPQTLEITIQEVRQLRLAIIALVTTIPVITTWT